jgi:hypothetical protein
MNRLGNALYSVFEDRGSYDTAKDEYEMYKLLYDFKGDFPSYTEKDLLSAALKGYMRNWSLHNEKTGLSLNPLLNEYIGDTPVDFGFRITKDIK